MHALKDEAASLDAAHRVTASVDADGNTTVHTYQDVEPHMEYAAKLRRADAENRGAFGKRGDMQHTMSVPFNVIQGIAQRLGIPNSKLFDKEYSQRIFAELKRPEFQVFRTTIDKKI